MKTMTVSEAEVGFARLLHWVASGEEVEITENQQPVAKVVPLRKPAATGVVSSVLEADDLASPTGAPPPMDSSPIQMVEVRKAGLHLRFKQPLILAPRADETGTLLCVRYEHLDLDAFAPSHSELLDELQGQIALLWREYARATPEALTPGAQQLRANLLEQIEEVACAV